MILPRIAHATAALIFLLQLPHPTAAVLIPAAAVRKLDSHIPRDGGQRHSTNPTSSVSIAPTSGIPAEPTGVKTIHFGNGRTVRYKSSTGGSKSVCEMTNGVETISGYLDLSPTVHLFFVLFEARREPEKAGLDIWMNGGPGSPSSIGLFAEHGPCTINSDLKAENNTFSWNSIANMVYIDQPVGSGFSYAEKRIANDDFPIEVGFLLDGNPADGANGRYPLSDPSINTTIRAAMDMYEAVQLLIKAMPQLNHKIKTNSISINSESYGGHYAPTFTKYFLDQNKNLQNSSFVDQNTSLSNSVGNVNGHVSFQMPHIWLGNPSINYTAQLPGYFEYATNNPYGIQLVNSTEASAMQFNLFSNSGCMVFIQDCLENTANAGKFSDEEAEFVLSGCNIATGICRELVEGIPESSGLGRVYDIRKGPDDQPPGFNFAHYLNLPTVQDALGVDLNFTFASEVTAVRFEQSGDFVDDRAQSDIEQLIDMGVYVVVPVGDADYICNYKGNLALFNTLQYSKGQQFANTDFASIMVNDKEVGLVRQIDNFAFAIIYDASHLVPGDQPETALAIWTRMHNNVDIATGTINISLNSGYATNHTGGSPVPTVTHSPLPQPTFPGPQ